MKEWTSATRTAENLDWYTCVVLHPTNWCNRYYLRRTTDNPDNTRQGEDVVSAGANIIEGRSLTVTVIFDSCVAIAVLMIKSIQPHTIIWYSKTLIILPKMQIVGCMNSLRMVCILDVNDLDPNLIQCITCIWVFTMSVTTPPPLCRSQSHRMFPTLKEWEGNTRSNTST